MYGLQLLAILAANLSLLVDGTYLRIDSSSSSSSAVSSRPGPVDTAAAARIFLAPCGNATYVGGQSWSYIDNGGSVAFMSSISSTCFALKQKGSKNGVAVSLQKCGSPTTLIIMTVNQHYGGELFALARNSSYCLREGASPTALPRDSDDAADDAGPSPTSQFAAGPGPSVDLATCDTGYGPNVPSMLWLYNAGGLAYGSLSDFHLSYCWTVQ